jgi:hypothetical protein
VEGRCDPVENDSPFIRTAKNIGAVTTIVVHIFGVAGLVIGLNQLKIGLNQLKISNNQLELSLTSLNQAKRLDEKRVALDAVNRTKEKDFLRVFARLKTLSKLVNLHGIEKSLDIFYEGDLDKKVMHLTDDINYILNAYDHISMLLLNKLGDEDILMQGVYPEVRELSKILDAITPLFPVGIARRNCDKMLALFQRRDWDTEKDYRYDFSGERLR